MLFINTLGAVNKGYGHLSAIKVPGVKGLKENRFVQKELSESGFRAHQLVENWAISCAHLELSDSTFVECVLEY